VLELHRAVENTQYVDFIRRALKVNDAVMTPKQYPHFTT